MATITLQDYYDKLEELLIKNANDEVIRHCRHILQFFPKNAKTFRYLGRALLESGEIEEAGEVFRRLLGVYPDDYTAHVALSEVYQKTNKPDDALWHLERAFEQDPNNQSLIDMLRELYQRYRKVEQAKMQLTAAAVARQYVRNELYGQAIDVLQQAIDRAPERMDLRVLLAQTLWDGNQRVEAAEHALDVLNTLPDCFAANRIMTVLWLDEQRPSDAQRFLSHIEGVEPYIALELAKGTSSPEDLTLDELDYSRLAQQELAMASPDWLQDLGDLGDQMMEDEPSFHELPADPTQPVPDDDWLKTLAEASAEKTVNLSKEDLLAAKKAAAERAQASGIDTEAPEDLFAEMEQTSKKPTSSLEGLFDDIPVSTSGTAGFTDFLDTLATAPTDRPSAPAATDDDDDDALAWLQSDIDEDSLPASDDRDPLSWMRDAGVEVDESASAGRFDPYGTDEKMEFRAPDTSNPLAWLQGEDEAPTAAADADDPLAWMRDAGIETVDENPTATPVVKPTAIPTAKPQRQNVGDDAFLDEMLDMEQLSSTGSWEVPAVSADQVAADDEMPDWISGADMTDEQSAEAVADEEDALSWMNTDTDQAPSADLFQEAVADEDDALSWMNAAEDEQPADDDFFAAPVAETDVPDWLSGANVLDDAPAEEAVAEEDDALSWMNAAEDEQVADDELFAAPVAQADVPDWLAGANVLDDASAEEAVAEEDDALAWMNAAEDEQVADDDLFAEPVAEADVPDWLSGANVLDETPVAEAVAEEDDDALSWMNAADDEQPADDELFATPIAEADVPDWLSGANVLDETPVAEAVAEEEDDALSWMNAADDEQPADDDLFAEPIAEADVPDWLSGANVLDETPVAEAVAEEEDDALSWMNAAAAEQATVEDDLYEEPVAEETPDWLSGTGFDEVTKPVMQDEEMSAWMNDDVQPEAVVAYITPSDEELPGEDSTLEEWQTTMSDDEQQPSFEVPAADGEALPLAEVRDDDYILGPVPPETLAQIQSQVVEEPVSDDVTPLPLDDIEEIPVAPTDDLPDLLAEPLTIPPQETLSDEEIAAQTDPAAAVVPLQELQRFEGEGGTPLPTDEAAVAEDVPDWLSVSDFADDESAEEVTAVEETPDWMASADFNEDIVAEETPDWLSGTGFVEDEPVEEEAVAEDTPDWLSEMSLDDEQQAVEAVIAEETPDWLSGTGFAEDEAVEEETVAEDTPDWLSEMSLDDEQQAVEAVIAEETPDWLSGTGFAEDEAVEEEAVAEDAPDWLSDMSFDDDQDEQPAAVASTDDDEQALDWMVEPGADAGAQDEVDWMSELEEAAPTNEVAAQGDDFAWMEDEEQSDYQKPAISQGNTDWLNSVGISKREPAEQTDDFGETYDWADDTDDMETEAVAEDSPDWLSDMQTQQGSIDAPAEPVQAGVSEYGWEDDLNEKPVPASMEDDFVPASEELIAVPADNAPDWLNAMIPGLDVDPTAEEDESYERDFVTDAGGHRMRSALDPEIQRDFDWVSDIVEEETSSQPAAAPSMMPELPSTPEPKAPKQPRFSFSRLPAWLRRKPAAAPAPTPAPVSVTEEPEWLREAEDTGDNRENTDDIDLPDWLK